MTPRFFVRIIVVIRFDNDFHYHYSKAMKYNNRIFLLVPVFVIILLFAIIGLGHLIDPKWIGEQPDGSGYIQKAFGLITDAPHATAELFYSTLEDIVILAVGFTWGRHKLRQEHKKFDIQHNIEHE